MATPERAIVQRGEWSDLKDGNLSLAARMSDDVVRLLIRQRINDGRLPRHRVIEVGYGSGVGRECDACGGPIEPDQRITVRICTEDWRTIRLHDDCFQIWDVERSLVERDAGAW